MMDVIRAYLSKGYWRHGFSITNAARSLLAAFGALWLGVEICMFFELTSATKWLKDHWWVFCTAGIGWAIWETRPKHSVTCTLKNRDVKIEIKVGSLFDGNAALVIGSNTSFDTDIQLGLISPKSIQGQYTLQYYESVPRLDEDISQALLRARVMPIALNEEKFGKQHLFPVGTTVKVSGKGRTAYLCAIAHMNAHGNASASFEDLQTALPKLWEHVTAAGDHGSIAVPILGSGFGRIVESRESIIREILQSFIAACSSQLPCSSLTVVIRPEDYYEFNVNLTRLGAFLTHLCTYTDFAVIGAGGRGEALPVVAAQGAQIVDGGRF